MKKENLSVWWLLIGIVTLPLSIYLAGKAIVYGFNVIEIFGTITLKQAIVLDLIITLIAIRANYTKPKKQTVEDRIQVISFCLFTPVWTMFLIWIIEKIFS